MLHPRRVALLCVALCIITWSPTSVAYAQNPAITINVNAAANRRPINPYIYGVAYATASELADLNCPLNRYGGNNTSRYNWQLNADNRGRDWYFQSIGEASAVAGERGDQFISLTKSARSEAMMTIPMLGWVAKLGANRSKLASFSISKYGEQTDRDWQWFPDAGNGVRTGGQDVTGNDPGDASVLVDSLFQQGWVQHIVNRWGTATSGGLRFYILDNEPSIWHSTHRDVQPTGARMEEVRDKIFDYAGRIKATDPAALVVGPEEWGWSGYFFSGYDQQYGSRHGWSNLPDRANHGDQDYLPWLLAQLRQHQTTTGQRLLDIFSVHYYPQGGEYSDDVSETMQQRRNRSTRALWDANYLDPTWINDRVQLIPRLRRWVNTHYPGTQIAITEYNWGAEGHINGATTQSDILGIFGREGLDMATRWTTPAASTPTYKAIKMYRNYDGRKSTFGETSVSAVVPNADNVSAFAALRSRDGALTVMVISKYLQGSTPTTINLANFAAQGTAQVWQLTDTNRITRLSDLRLSGSSFTATLPKQSITLFVIPQATTAPAAAYSISGQVRVGASGPALVGATMTLTSTTAGFTPRTVQTTSTGNYTFANLPAGRSYILKPTKTNYNFTPSYRSYTSLAANQTLQNFTATLKNYSISGRVTAAGTTTGISAVTMTITSPTPAGFAARTVQTTSTGNYVFTGLPAGRNYTIKPTKAGYAFTPATKSFTNLSANQPVSAATSFTGSGASEPVPDLGPGASLHGKRLFPADNPWNQDISGAPVDSNSDNLIASMGLDASLHPDFGTVWAGAPNGIPYIVVSGTQRPVPINFTDYGDESDAGPYPVPAGAPIEGGPSGTGDRHVIVIDRDNWMLYELYRAFPINNGASWNAASGAVFNLSSNALRPAGWTSADAAGLPIFPGLVRYDEVFEQREITHALRFTAEFTRRAYVYPARHYASSDTNPNLPPMGMRVRLKASFDISRFSPAVQVILRAMKKYGMILADNGSNWFVSGAPDPRWSDDELSTLGAVHGSDFEVVQMGAIVSD
jgi:Glycoside hydrolase family 44/Prealbumin-like fold domain